jgi:hypothetical protein
MVNLTIDSLQLQVQKAAGHEHRLHGIAQRAASILGQRLSERYRTAEEAPDALHLDVVTAPVLQLDLNHISDDEAAGHVANAWLDAHALRLRV